VDARAGVVCCSRSMFVGMDALVTADDVNRWLATGWPGSPNTCTDVGARHAVATLTVTEAQIRPGNLISGPTQFAMADAVLYYAVFGAIGIEPMAVTSELSIRFLRPAAGITLWGRADLLTVGRRTIVGSISVWTNDPAKPCAVAQGTYLRPAEPR
jgi:uncharacterized protein (TIGR00369 family)